MKKYFLIIVILFGPTFLSASISIDQVMGNMEIQSKGLQNIKFNFHQEIQFFNSTGATEVTGEAIFQKPGKLRVVKKGHEEQITISNGKRIWVYTPAFKQVWEGNPEKWLRSPLLPKGIVPLDNFVEDLKRDFYLRLSEGSSSIEKGIWILANPKDKELGYSLELCVSTHSWLPIKTIFHSETAKIVTELLDTQINSTTSVNLFQFQPPKGTEVIPLN